MKILNKFSKLFIPVLVVLAIVVATGHLCALAHHAPEHNTVTHAAVAQNSYETGSFEKCCAGNTATQLKSTRQQVQKYSSITLIITTTPLTAVISPYAIRGGFFRNTFVYTQPHPGGLVLRC